MMNRPNQDPENQDVKQDPTIGRLLAELPIPDHQPDFWDLLATELKDQESDSRRRLSEQGRFNSSRVLLIAAAMAVALLAVGALLAIGQVRQPGKTDAANSTTTTIPNGTTTATTSTPPTTAGAAPAPTASSTVPSPPGTSFIETVPSDRDGSEVVVDPAMLNVAGLAAAMPGPGRRIVHLEPTGRFDEGCEGGDVSINRLVLADLDSGDRNVLTEDLPTTDQSIDVGPNGELAIVGGCDANAWLAAVGQIGPGGELKLERLPEEAPARIGGSNNFGYTTTWAEDGRTLYFNSVRVSIDDGAVTAIVDDGTIGLDGTRIPDGYQLDAHLVGRNDLYLVSGWLSSNNHRGYWILDDPAQLFEPPVGAPIFFDDVVPAYNHRVEISDDGSRILVTSMRNTPAATTYIIGPGADDVVAIPGEAVMSPDGSQILVSRQNDDSPDVVDHFIVELQTGETITIADITADEPAMVRSKSGIVQVMWCCDDRGLLVQSDGYSLYFELEPK